MARKQGISIQNNFVGGLITETTALRFPENACTETFNCVFNEKGRVLRRPSLDIETSYTLYSSVKEDTYVVNEYLWQAISGSGTLSFLVVQHGKYLYFYDVSNSTDGSSSNKKGFSVDLDSYIVSGTSLNPASNYCSFSSGRGDLIVCNEACDPFSVSYNESSDTITVTSITLEQRDFIGLEDSLEITERPTYATVADLRTGNTNHYYNLLNQGWHVGSDANTGSATTDAPLHQWATARTDMPSNADYVGLYRSSITDGFDNANVLANTPGNRRAPSGHFILDVANPNRATAITDDGWAGGVFAGDEIIEISRTNGTIIYSTGTAAPSYSFDGNDNTTYTYCTSWSSTGYIGKTLSAPKKIYSAKVISSNNYGFNVSGTSVNFSLYAKNGAAPTSRTDGTLLGSTGSFTDTNVRTEKTIVSSDTATSWDHVWINQGVSPASEIVVAEVVFNEIITGTGSSGQQTYKRPRVSAFYAGRAWYAGLNADGYNNSLFFSQIIERSDQYGKCYQVNDPTAEDFFDLLATDGGVIKIPEMANVVKMHVYQKSLLVFATNGVWIVRGSGGTQFSATNYSISKLSSLGTQSPLSFVDVKGFPVWWGEDGILLVSYNPQYDSFAVESLTDESIKSFFLEIPAYNRQFVKGAYDVQNQIIYWFYNDTASLEDTTVYDACLCFNTRSKAFYPWTWTNTSPEVRGLVYSLDSIGTSTPKIKLVLTSPHDATHEYVYFGELYSSQYTDWESYAANVGTAADESDYTSYFITGYKLDGETQKFFQPNYLFVFSDSLINSSVFVQGIYDFTNSGNSGKWSSKQQGYNSALDNRDVMVRRLKIRGKGRALQFKYTSETGKPFSIIGWSIFETTNGNI